MIMRVQMSERLPAALTLAALCLFSGCTVGPDFKRPPAPQVKTYTDGALPGQTASAHVTGGAAQHFVDNQPLDMQWWKWFDSPALNALMDEALKANPDLEAARASLRQAQENVYAQEGNLFPTVNVNPTVTREKFSPAAFGQTNTPSSLFTLYNASVTVSYGIDVFGVTRRAIESSQAQADYQRYEMEAAYLTLTTNIVTAAVQEASLRGQIKETHDIIDIERKQLNVLKKQLAFGGVPKTSVLEQEATLAQMEATLPPLEKQLALQRNQLSVLTGHFPSEKLDAVFDLSALHLPETLPLSLPSQLVEQRPDIKAAEAQLHSASAQIGVATANMLPQLTISGSYGPEATTFSGLSAASAPVWSLGAGILQPVFHGGSLVHERRAAVAAYDKAAAQYRSTVLSAFGNVADSLRALQFDADALNAQAYADRTATDSLRLARVQYKTGAISYPQLLDAQRSYAQVRISLVQAEAARFADTAALFQALGGGWQETPARATLSVVAPFFQNQSTPAFPAPAATPIPQPSVTNEKKS